MNKVAYALAIALAVFLILLGGIFVIASGIENIATGAVLIVIAIVLIFFAYRSDKMEASRPKLINQTFNVKMGAPVSWSRRG